VSKNSILDYATKWHGIHRIANPRLLLLKLHDEIVVLLREIMEENFLIVLQHLLLYIIIIRNLNSI
jgi:hypothetical protein